MFKNGTISLIALVMACQLTGCRSLPIDPHPRSTGSATPYDAGLSAEIESEENPTSNPSDFDNSGPTNLLQPASFRQIAPRQTPERLTTLETYSLEPSISIESLEDLETLALENNPALAGAHAVVSGRHGRWIQAGLPSNPTIGYLGEDMGAEDTLGAQGVFIQQEFVRGGKLGWSQAVAGAGINQANAEVAAMRQRVLTDVRIGYIDFLVGSRRLQLVEQLVAISNQIVRDTDELFRRGELRRADVLRAEAEASRTSAMSQNAITQRNASWRRLALAIGLPNLGRPTMAADEVQKRLNEAVSTSIDHTAAIEAIINSSPQLASLRSSVDQAQNRLERAYVESIPDVKVQISMQYDHVADSTVGGIQVGMAIPYRNWNQGNIQEASAKVCVALQAVDTKALDLQRRFETVYTRYRVARTQVNHYNEPTVGILAKTAEVLRLTTLGYKAEEFNSIEMFTAQQLFHQANLVYLESVQQLWTAAVEIEGLLLKDSLQSIR
jgi:cobalt-zinc-cadmium efflux system outer membrane protein